MGIKASLSRPSSSCLRVTSSSCSFETWRQYNMVVWVDQMSLASQYLTPNLSIIIFCSVILSYSLL